VQMVAHGVSTGALFIIVGMIQMRVHTRDMDRMGGYWSTVPRLSAVGLVFALASLGLPGFGNFVAEFMVLLGTFRVNGVIAAVAAIGLVLAAIYSLWIVQRVFHGEAPAGPKLADLTLREAGMMASLIIVILWLGLYPRPVLNAVEPLLNALPGGTPQEQPLPLEEARR
jgi:NADH-quinone oxidoreductase subunit M